MVPYYAAVGHSAAALSVAMALARRLKVPLSSLSRATI